MALGATSLVMVPAAQAFPHNPGASQAPPEPC
jgi:hypothetical protein